MNARTNSQTKRRSESFKDAISQLNEAAKEKQQDLQSAVEHQYTDLKQAVSDAWGGVSATGQGYMSGVKKKAEDALASTEKNLKATAEVLDDKLREDPWMYLGVAAAGAFVLGFSFAFGRSKNRTSTR